MSLARWKDPGGMSPFREMRSWQDEMERLFGHWPLAERWLPREEWGDWCPEVDVLEEESRIIVRVDIPGMDPKQLEVEVNEGSLTLRANGLRRKKRRRGNTTGVSAVTVNSGAP